MSFTIFQNEKTPLQAIKTRSSRSRKIDIFPKGLSHGFGPNVAMFPAFFQALIVEKMSFTIFQNDKAPFQAIKTRSLKSRKTDNFPKRLSHGFGPNMAIFPTFFYYAIQVTEMFFTIFQIEKTPIQAVKTRSTISRKIDIFPKALTQDFGPNVAIFPTFFFQAIQVRKMTFTILQNEKTPFQAIKKESSKFFQN